VNLKEYMKSTDRHLYARLDPGTIENLLDEAIELLEDVMKNAKDVLDVPNTNPFCILRLEQNVNEFYKDLEDN